MTDEELEKISIQIFEKNIANSIGKAAVDSNSIEQELQQLNRYKSILKVQLRIVDKGISIINSFKKKGANND